MAGALHAWAIYKGINLVHILQYTPQTQLLEVLLIKLYLFPFVTVEIVLVLHCLNMDALVAEQKMM